MNVADFFFDFPNGARHSRCPQMRASPEFVTLFVRGLAWDAAQSGRSLIEVLEICCRGKLVDWPRCGQVIAGSTADEVATLTFTLPPLGGLAGDGVTKLAGELLERARAIVASSPELTDDALAAMLALRSPDRRGEIARASLALRAA